MVHLAALAGGDFVKAVAMLEKDERVLPSHFKGAESLIEPDARELVIWVISCGKWWVGKEMI